MWQQPPSFDTRHQDSGRSSHISTNSRLRIFLARRGGTAAQPGMATPSVETSPGGSTAEMGGTMPKAWTEGSICLIAADAMASLPGVVLLKTGTKLMAAELGAV